MARYQTELLFDNRQISLFTCLARRDFPPFSLRHHRFQSRTSDTCQNARNVLSQTFIRVRDRCRRSRLAIDKLVLILRRLRLRSQMTTIHRAHTSSLPLLFNLTDVPCSSRRNRRRGGRSSMEDLIRHFLTIQLN